MDWPRFIVSYCMTQRDYGGQGKFFFSLLCLVFLLLVFNFLFIRSALLLIKNNFLKYPNICLLKIKMPVKCFS